MLNAPAEVSSTLIARQKFAESRAELGHEVVALQESVRLSTLSYHAP